jgi:hypothetical protein
MTDARNTEHPHDAALIAYLDGELNPAERASISQRLSTDPDLRNRLILLSGGNRPFRDAFDALLAQAPRERLESGLAGLSAVQIQPARHVRAAPRWGNLRAIAAGIMLFLAGLGADRWLSPWNGHSGPPSAVETEAESDDDWRRAVAEYLTLYTSETLAGIPTDANLQGRELAMVGEKLGLRLSQQRTELPDLSLRRAQIFEYDGKSLGQIAYLDPQSGPLALCIIADGAADAAQQVEQRQGFNIVFWSRNGHSFMLIGRAGIARLQNYANDLSGRLAG